MAIKIIYSSRAARYKFRNKFRRTKQEVTLNLSGNPLIFSIKIKDRKWDRVIRMIPDIFSRLLSE